jgi:uncharacterized protein
MPVPRQPLTDTQLDRLDDLLRSINPGITMSLEELDGFFCALICSPEVVPPCEYMPHIFGGELLLGRCVSSAEEERELLNLLTRHWHTIAATLHGDEPHTVLMGNYGNDGATGLDWAHGFELGMSLREDGWNRLINDDKFTVALVPIVALAESHSLDSGLPPITRKVREAAVGALGESVLMIYRYFKEMFPSGNAPKGWSSPKLAYTARMEP